MRSAARLHYWAVKTDETSRLDGRRVRLHLHWWKSLKVEHGKVLMLFSTRTAARAWIKEDRAYIGRRPDMRREPHCWRVGKPVRVTVAVTED